MKTISLILMLGLSGFAAAGYKEAEAALKNVETEQIAQISKDLDALLPQSGAALARDARAAALLSENQQAMELFRQAAEAPNEGYLFAPKPEKYSTKTPLPKFFSQMRLFRLLLIEAKIKLAEKQPGPAEKDLLAAAGLILQLSGQKSAVLLSSMVGQLCLNLAYPVMLDSIKNPSVSPAYLKELAARLAKAANSQDAMKAAVLDETAMWKGAMREGVNAEAMALEREKLPFWKRPAAKKLQDQEFFTTVYADYDAAVDAYAGVLTGAFRANDPAPVVSFLEKRSQEVAARKAARVKKGFFSELVDGLKGGPEMKKKMGEVIVDTMLEIATPAYEKTIPRYHFFLCELNVLRAGLAVKLYQRARRRLPDGLDQLVPGFLAAVPQDSFSKFAPLSYVKTGKKFSVYSFGPDGKDGGGAAAMDYKGYIDDPARSAGDIVFAD